MRQGVHLRPVRLPQLLVVAAAAASVAGCAFFDPYVGMKPAKTEGAERDKIQFAGEANQAIAQVEAVRQEYFSGMRQIGATRAAFATGATVITGYALYNTLKPNPPGATEPSFETKRTTVALGAVLATSLGLSEYALNKGQESAYNVGYQALTCLLRQSAPLLMPLYKQADVVEADNVQTLQHALAKLSKEIDALERAVASARVGVAEGQVHAQQWEADAVRALIAANDALPDKPAAADKSGKAKKPGVAPAQPAKLSPEELSAAVGKLTTTLPPEIEKRPHLPRTIRDAEKALGYARRTLEDGKKLLQAVVGSGREIQERAHSIVSTVNGLIRAAQPDLKAADVSLSSAQDIVSGFKKIGSDTAEDQADTTNGSSSSSLPAAFDARKFAAMATPRASQRWAVLGGPGVSMMGSSLAAVMAANAVAAQQAASAPAAAASAPAAAASGVKAAPPPAPKPPPAKPPAPAKLTMEELEKLQGLIESTLKQARQRQAEEAQEKLIGGYKSKFEDLAKPREVCWVKGGRARCDTEQLALRIEDLYAARRPVAATVLHFRAQTKVVRRVAGCPSDSGIRVTPSESIVVQAGETYSFVVTQPNVGSPVAMLQGALGEDLGSLTTTSLGTAGLQAKVQFGKKAKGRYVLQATDSTGDFSESVQIFVKGAPPEKKKDDAADKPKSAASAAGDS